METVAVVFGTIICALAWHRRRLLIERHQLQRQVWLLQNAQVAPVAHRLYFAPYEAAEPTERWAGPSIPPGEYRASGAPYNVFARGYLN